MVQINIKQYCLPLGSEIDVLYCGDAGFSHESLPRIKTDYSILISSDHTMFSARESIYKFLEPEIFVHLSLGNKNNFLAFYVRVRDLQELNKDV